MAHLLYIGQAPNHGTGSPTILLRHLKRLAANGWSISILAEWGNETTLCKDNGWQLHTLPHREAWWPPLPLKFEAARRLKVHLWARWLLKNIQPKPEAILCYLAWHGDLFCEVACCYGRMAKIPVTCIVHDDATAFSEFKGQERLLRQRQARILRHNHRNWFVSREQAMEMAPAKAHQGILPPLPEGNPWPPLNKTTQTPTPLRLYYAGYLWPEQAHLLATLSPQLRKAGAELLIISRPTEAVLDLERRGLARHLPLFPTNQEALEHLRSQASALIVSYTHKSVQLPWTRTSMPSKLIEYSFLQLPIALIAPEDTSVMKWAKAEGLKSALLPDDEAGIRAWIDQLKSSETRDALAAEWLPFSEGLWNPERIHQKLEQNLL